MLRVAFVRFSVCSRRFCTVDGSQHANNSLYKPVAHHWFFQNTPNDKFDWKPFTHIDNKTLEDAYKSLSTSDDKIVSTDGGRFDVDLTTRQRSPVYWRENPTSVKRCSWFYKGTTDPRYIPYNEDIANLLEEEYRLGAITSTWNRRIHLEDEEIVFHSSSIIMRFIKASSPDSWGGTPLVPSWTVHRGISGLDVEPDELAGPADHLLFLVHGIGEPKKDLKPCGDDQAPSRARAVRRGADTTDVEEGEKEAPDHLLMLIHGIGSSCDIKMRSVEEVVNDFRSITSQLVQAHYKESRKQGLVNRIEVLPISWHWNLHSDELESRIAEITLESVPKFRNFANDTLLDILYYTSPKFCQTIISTVGNEMNRLYELYKQRNPGFKGKISLGGHSLGSVIVFDLLCHQKLPEPSKAEEILSSTLTGQSLITYPQLGFCPQEFFALGSPIAIFTCVRGIEGFGEDFKLPTCSKVFNIFHPFDPVAYRIEPLVSSKLSKLSPAQIPHHKGRKRMHLELRDTVTRVGADLKQKVFDSINKTWGNFFPFNIMTGQTALQEKVSKVIEEELKKAESGEVSEGNTPDAEKITEMETALMKNLGQLNEGRRIDYVLQEAPFELFNEYIFALVSHVCYWESEDTILMIVKEIYAGHGIETDQQVAQPTLTMENPSSEPSTSS